VQYSGTYLAGLEYVQLAVGQPRLDLDLYLFDENRKLIKKDEREGPHCVAVHSSPGTGKLKVVLQAHQGSGWYGYLVLHGQD
jgi:hypothetical protein